jgi:hypothetical protein
MLGCHEFCGYYDWTFHFFRRRWGQEAVARLWAEAIGGDSQVHYAEAGLQGGLVGLHRCWVKTGEEESCDWTFTLDESRNVLRWDMRQCPSKGFLLASDRNADEDYCDHCMGWTIPLLARIGIEVGEHEHNHQGQCWGTMHRLGSPTEPVTVKADIRRDPRWNAGYLERWEHNKKQPVHAATSDSSDPCEVVLEWFAGAERLVVVGSEPPAGSGIEVPRPSAGLIAAPVYARCGDLGLGPTAVLIAYEDQELDGVAQRYSETPTEKRPLLLHPYLPARPPVDFLSHGLPRPLPLLPLLIRTGLYEHRPCAVETEPRTLLMAMAGAIGKPCVACC